MPRVDEADASPLGERPIGGREAKRLFRPALEHLGIFGELLERRRCDEADFWRPALGAGRGGEREVDQPFGAGAEVSGVAAKLAFTSLQPREMITRSIGAWLLRQGAK